MSKLITNTIRHTGGSADNITLDNSQNVTFEADAVVDGRVNIGSTGGFDSNGDDLTITNASHGGITIKTGTSSDGIIRFGDGSGAAEYRGYINYKHADDALVLGTGANERVRVDSGGGVKILDGDLIIGTSGHGIDFSATSDATGKDNELFSDYEEGNWSPVIGATGGSVSVTYTTQKGWYVRSGRVVHLWFDCAWNSGSSQSGNLRLDGFPYTTSNNDDWKAQYVGPIMMTDVDVDGNAKTIVFHSWNNTTQGEFYATTDNASWTATGYDTAGRIIGQIQLLAGA